MILYHCDLAYRDYQYLTSGALEMLSHLFKFTELKHHNVIASVATLLLRGLDLAYSKPEFKDFVETNLVAAETDLCQWLELPSVIGSNKFEYFKIG